MKRRRFLELPLGLGLTLPAHGQAKPRLRRKDSFFGLHLDLHVSPADTALGRDVSDEMVGSLLDRVQPDFVQYDCKGHPGWLAYPSKVAPYAPHIVKDSLEVWRRQTAKRGVGLYIHFSGLWDDIAVERHPEWARVGPDGKPDKRKTSTFGPYVDEWMIPELHEAATKYSLDGAWVDGECWAAAIDYSERAAKAWGKPMPKGPNDPGWREFLDFNREQFRHYVAHYVDALKQTNPDFQVASNWMYTTFVPEKPTIPVAYLSGDFLGNAAMSTARLEARYLAATGMPWDLMAWGFNWGEQNKFGNVWKPAVQLEQEASVVLAQGGGFQIYYVPTRTGYIDDTLVGTMQEVASFCRARQKWAHKSEPIPQVAVVFSGHSLYQTSNQLFGGWDAATDPVRGIIDALVESHYSVEVLPDWKLGEAARYPLIVVPDWTNLGADAARSLRDYASDGGTLLLVGAANTKLFAADLGVTFSGNAATAEALVPGRKRLGNASGLWQPVALAGAQALAQRFPITDTTRDAAIAATGHSLGRGRIAAVYGPIGAAYVKSHDPATREFLAGVVDRLWKPDLQVDGPPMIEVALRKKDGRTIVHLLNSAAMQVASEYAGVDYVPPVGPVRVALKLPAAPKSAVLAPDGQSLAMSYRDGRIEVTVPVVAVHSMVVFEG
jgi:hypothetical protein